MKYRDHKGSFEDSMKTLQEFDNIEDLKRHINSTSLFEVDDIKFAESCIDHRMNWGQSFYVMVKPKGLRSYYVAGISDGTL